ncbi:hypothetical protein Alches_17420 [Alicyclobacillus hesperidum subsp. aegles]|nr:hypothetical protein Alches_17420 [Alicyclobacillus hesperidum subsp. aegles]
MSTRTYKAIVNDKEITTRVLRPASKPIIPVSSTESIKIIEAKPLKMHRGLPTVVELTYSDGAQVHVLEYVLRHPNQGKTSSRKHVVDKP